MSGWAPEPGDLSDYMPIEGDDENYLLLETGDLVSKFDLWFEGFLAYEQLSERDKRFADKLMDKRMED